MPRALVAKPVLDSLIRNKLAHMPSCEGVEALPVKHEPQRSEGCNWVVPGWVGNARRIEACRHQLEAYVRFLGTQFDIPEEPPAGGG